MREVVMCGHVTAVRERCCGELLVPFKRRCRAETALAADPGLSARCIRELEHRLARFAPVAQLARKQRPREHYAPGVSFTRDPDIRELPAREHAAVALRQQ